MPKVSDAVRRETAWVAAWTVGLTLVMNLVFAFVGKWDTGVLAGSLLGCGVAVGCFFWLGLTVQKAVGREAKSAKGVLQVSQLARLLVQGGALAAGFAIPGLNGWAVMIPLFFPQIAVRLRPLWKKGMRPETAPGPGSDAQASGDEAKGGDALD